MATTAKSLKVPCPACGSKGESLTLDLNDMGKIECGGCGESFTPQRAVELAREALALWESIARWIDTGPL